MTAGPAAGRGEGADGRFHERRSAHFVLLQDVDIDQRSGRHGWRRFELDVLEVLESAFTRVDDLLGLRPRRPLQVVVYDAAIFDAEFRGLFRFAAAGFYQGVIRIRGGSVVDNRLVRVLHHEYVHAALDAVSPSVILPAWLNEGTAEWIERRALGLRRPSPGEYAALQRLAAGGALFPLDTLSLASFGGFSAECAGVAYLQSYGFVDQLVRRHGERSFREFLEVLLRVRRIERAAKRAFGKGLAELEGAFLAELGG